MLKLRPLVLSFLVKPNLPEKLKQIINVWGALQEDHHHDQVLLRGGGAEQVDEQRELVKRGRLDHLRARR